MRTKDVRIDADLNKMVWSKGIKCVGAGGRLVLEPLFNPPFRPVPTPSRRPLIRVRLSFSRNVPFRIRVQIARKRNEDEDAAEPMYSLVTFVSLTNLKGTLSGRRVAVWPRRAGQAAAPLHRHPASPPSFSLTRRLTDGACAGW